MKDRITALYREANEFNTRAQAIITEYSGKTMSQEKSNEVDSLLDQVEEKANEAKRLERAMDAEAKLREPQNRLGGSTASGQQDSEISPEAKAFQRFLKHGQKALTDAEAKALRADEDTAGGYLTAPQQFASGLLKFVDDAVVVRRLATVEQLTMAESLGVISMDSDMSDWEWTSELATGSEDTVKPFGGRALTPHALAKRVKISNTLIRRSTRPIEQIIQQRLGYKLSVTLEKGYMTGSGAQQPLGMFTASNQGIPTSRDITLTVTDDETFANSLIDAKFGLKEAYQNSDKTRWLFHRDFLKRVRKLRDGNKQFLWAAGLAGGQPATILDIPYVQSEFAPNTFSSGNYQAVLGDISFYWIVDALTIQIQTLLELYAESNQRGYIGRYEGDGAPMLAEAFVRLKHA
ncbi:MAG TPA: phage major capsid protein [Roseiflexaceae bacterium]|nr:phage major capsid protein [Roseiflexaceae bacterium]